MPEGDTVFRVAEQLRDVLVATTLSGGELRHPRLSTIELRGWRINEVASVGKHLFIRFAHGRSLHSHLGMDGVWHVHHEGQRWRAPAHQARVVLRCPGRVVVGFRLHDLALVARQREDQLVGHLGPDLLSEQWDHQHEAEVSRRMSANPRAPLGAVLLDQEVLAGVGNVYQAEICFLLGVSPFHPVGELDGDTCSRAIRLARDLLWDNRLRTHRTTTGDERPTRQHWVYRRAGMPCRRCGTHLRAASLPVGAHVRRTWFCPRCQDVR